MDWHGPFIIICTAIGAVIGFAGKPEASGLWDGAVCGFSIAVILIGVIES